MPPPYHGVTISTSLVLANEHLRDRFDVHHVDTSDDRSTSNTGRWDVTNVAVGLRGALQLLRLMRGPAGVVYLPLSANVPALLRDSLYVHLAATRGWAVTGHMRGSDFPHVFKRAPRLAREWIRLTLGRLDSVAVMGESLRWIFAGLIKPERIAVIWNGTPDLAHDGVGRDRHTGLFLSNLRRRKGVVEALEAALIVVREHPSARFVFAGAWESDELEQELRERASAADGRIVFHPVVTGDAHRDLLASVGFLLFPPVMPEGHPRVVIEALGAGLPVIATDRGAIAETVVDGESGFVLADPDPSEMAARMLALLNDEAAWKRMSAAARARYLERYTVDVADRRLAEWLEDVARKHSAA